MSPLINREKVGPFNGLDNIMSLEASKWLDQNRWLIQSVIWLLFVNGLMSLGLVIAPLQGADITSARDGVVMFAELLFSIGPVGVIVLTQGDMINEIQDGSMECMLTAPLSRAAVIIGKFVVNSAFLLSVSVLLQGAVGLVLINQFGEGTIQSVSFLVSLTVHGLHLLFWISLTLMLGAFVEKRAVLLGSSIGFLLFQGLIGTTLGRIHPIFQEILPGVLQRTALEVALGSSLTGYLPVLATITWVILFIGLAVWRFNNVEF